MFVFLVIVATAASMAFQVTNAQANCTLCEMNGLFTQLTGYSCYPTYNGSVACTCPDRRFTVDKPCRVCERENVCGNSGDSMCAESSPSSLGNDNNNTPIYFACFCSSGNYYLGQPCPSPTTTTTLTTPVPVQMTTADVTIPNTRANF